MRSSVTLSEETAPVKLTSTHCPPPRFMGIGVRPQTNEGWYFTNGSTSAQTPASKPPTYPTQRSLVTNKSLQQRSTGSFRLAAGKRHLHRYYYFTESVVETVLQ
eukprot:TRINITY_DN6072_c0_g1_i2.p1 TRINITY_DN6072_c0_g1~~TRINITY_DN6072_c0_g1_i2.p1  ORF type:complete len:104 (-),score=13.62 TRINITY_DN6072_c0_g1_i2:135-446(-)